MVTADTTDEVVAEVEELGEDVEKGEETGEEKDVAVDVVGEGEDVVMVEVEAGTMGTVTYRLKINLCQRHKTYVMVQHAML